MSWELPTTVIINGKEYGVETDYRDILDIISHLEDVNEKEQVNLYVALALFFCDFESIPQSDYARAIESLFWFINCGDIDTDSTPHPKRIDWEQDQPLIVADINKVAGCEIRALPYLHWWTFISYFNAIGEGQLSSIVAIREKLRKGKKLEAWEKDFYQENKRRIDFKPRYTQEEMEERERLEKLLGG